MHPGRAEAAVHVTAYSCLLCNVMRYEMEIIMWKGSSEWDAFCEQKANGNIVANVGVGTAANVTVRNSLLCIDIVVGGQ